MELRDLDLNLLRTLDVLLEQRSVSRAAEKLHISQPAASGALGRLRRMLGDELLVRRGKGMQLTPYAAQLQTRLSQIMSDLNRLLDGWQPFDPAVERNDYCIAASDHVIAVIGPQLGLSLAAAAPQSRLTWAPPTLEAERMLAAELLDAAILPHTLEGDFVSDVLFEDCWACVVAHDNPLLGDTISATQLQECEQIGMRPPDLSDEASFTRAVGTRRNIIAYTDNFSAAALSVAGTRFLAMLPWRLASRLAPTAGLRIVWPDHSLPPLTMFLCWSLHMQESRRLTWLRQLIATSVAELEPLPARP